MMQVNGYKVVQPEQVKVEIDELAVLVDNKNKRKNKSND